MEKTEETIGEALKFLRDLGYLGDSDIVKIPRARFEDLCVSLEEVNRLIGTNELPRAQGLLDGLGVGLRMYLKEGTHGDS